MKHALLGLMAVVLLAAPTAFGAPRMICKDTGKEVKKCCCDIKDGKFVCSLSKKTHAKCCCESKA